MKKFVPSKSPLIKPVSVEIDLKFGVSSKIFLK